jgi:hypothetical protein
MTVSCLARISRLLGMAVEDIAGCGFGCVAEATK